MRFVVVDVRLGLSRNEASRLSGCCDCSAGVRTVLAAYRVQVCADPRALVIEIAFSLRDDARNSRRKSQKMARRFFTS